MVPCNPVFDLVVKLRGLDDDLFRFGLRATLEKGVVNRVSLSPTGLTIIRALVRGFAQHKFRAF